MTFELEHPELGSVLGEDRDNVIEFRGIPYATLENKFAEAIFFTNPEHQAIDARRQGPCAICPPDACTGEQAFLQHSLPHDAFEFSDTKCLNMNIICPKTEKKKLPVFVYVHGGGFAIGSNAWPQYDLKRIVALSIEKDCPVLAIGINYRLGIHGFLTSSEMVEAGIKPNRGLRDQQVAFKWIRKYISGFSGDCENVTAVAESAGSVGLFYHLHCPDPLFDQMISMAGTPLLMQPPPAAFADQQYRSALKCLGIDQEQTRSGDRIDQLITTTSEDLLQKIPPSIIVVPIVDGDIVKESVSFADWENKVGFAKFPHRWCSRILIGDCQLDANIMGFFMPPSTISRVGPDFVELVTRVVGEKHPEVAHKLLSAYGSDQNANEDEVLERVLHFAQDIGFWAPVKTIAETWESGSAFMYHFNELNPWEGRWKGVAGHAMDIIFALQNYNDYLSPAQMSSARLFGEHVLKFVNAQQPFPAYQSGMGGAMVYGLDGVEGKVEFVTGVDGEKYGKRDTVMELSEEVGLDYLAQLWQQFKMTH